jgi:hypothetical protein
MSRNTIVHVSITTTHCLQDNEGITCDCWDQPRNTPSWTSVFLFVLGQQQPIMMNIAVVKFDIDTSRAKLWGSVNHDHDALQPISCLNGPYSPSRLCISVCLVLPMIEPHKHMHLQKQDFVTAFGSPTCGSITRRNS